MAINEICVLLQTPLTKRDYDRFGIETLLSRGFKVTILDATEILQPSYLKRRADYYSSNTYAYVMPRERSVDIDDEYDFKLAECLFNDK